MTFCPLPHPKQLYLLRIPVQKGDGGILTKENTYNKDTFDPSFSFITVCWRFNLFLVFHPGSKKYLEICRFRDRLLSELSKGNTEENEEGLSGFLNICKRILDLHSPRKQRYARGSHTPFRNRALSKEITTRTRLWNNFSKAESQEKKSIQNNSIIVYHY